MGQLALNADRNPDLFIDKVKMRLWRKGYDEGYQDQLQADGYLDARGWPQPVGGTYPPPGTDTLRIVFDGLDADWLDTWVLIWEGTQAPVLDNVANVVTTDHRYEFTSKPSGGAAENFGFNVPNCSASPNNTRNIRMFRKSEEALLNSGAIFSPRMLATYRSVAPSVVRLMDFGYTNGSPQTTWASRAVYDYQSWATGKGFPIEVMIAFANAIVADPWFCIPHQADDDYVEEFATLVQSDLDDGLTPHFEYSNETWNGFLGQQDYCQTQGVAAGWTTGTSFDKSQQWAGYRSAQVSEIIRAVFGSDSGAGWVGVLATWAVDAYHTDRRLEGVARHITSDVGVPGGTTVAKLFKYLAPAFYFGSSMLYEADKQAEFLAYSAGHTQQQTFDWITSKMLDPTYVGSVPSVATALGGHKTAATAVGLLLAAYEGGTHLQQSYGVTITGPNMAAAYAVLEPFSYSPQIATVYAAWWAAWLALTSGPIAHFTTISGSSTAGCWGIKRSYDDLNSRSAAIGSLSRGLDYEAGKGGVTATLA